MLCFIAKGGRNGNGGNGPHGPGDEGPRPEDDPEWEEGQRGGRDPTSLAFGCICAMLALICFVAMARDGDPGAAVLLVINALAASLNLHNYFTVTRA